MTYEQVYELISIQLNVDVRTLTPETSFAEDLGADSLDMVELHLAAEDNDFIMPDKILETIKTIGDFFEYFDIDVPVKKYSTRPIDYTGCHPVIAEHLKKGLAIECSVDEGNKALVDSYAANYKMYYAGDYSYSEAVPLEHNPTTTYVKKASEIIKWLEENGYTPNRYGGWDRGTHVAFPPSMVQHCGKPLDKNDGYKWLPEWLEERPIEEK